MNILKELINFISRGEKINKNTDFFQVNRAAMRVYLLPAPPDNNRRARKTSVVQPHQYRNFRLDNLEQGDTESLTIEAPRDFLRYITAEVEDGTLVIGTRRGFVGAPVQRVTFTINVINLEEISLSGAGAVKVLALETDDFFANLSGAGSIEIDNLTAEDLNVNLSSAGAIVIAGKAQSQSVNLSGVGSYEAGDLETASADVNLSGAGSAVV